MKRQTWMLWASTALVLSSCGANPNTGSSGGGARPGNPPPFSQSCQNRNGTVIPAAGATPELCRQTINLTASWFNSEYNFIPRWSSPRLTPTDFSTATPTYPVVDLKPGDRVTFSATGRWDKSDGWQCQNWRDLNGVISGGVSYNPALPSTLAQPQGMLALDGGTVRFMGGNSTWTVQNGGILYIGLNMTGGNNDSYCWSVYPVQFHVTHCENATGTTFACP